MEKGKRAVFVGVIGFVGTVIFNGLTVCPFQYGLLQGAVMAGGFVLAALVVLDTVF